MTLEQRNGLGRLESQLVPAVDGMKFVGTLENLCKLPWRQDRKRLLGSGGGW